jgi:membrane protein
VTRRFVSGKPPLKEEPLARALGVPLTMVESLINELVQAGMIVRTETPSGLVLAKPPGSISIVEVLRLVQHQSHNPSQTFTLGNDSISHVLMRRDDAIRIALEGMTLKDLVLNSPDSSNSDAKAADSPEAESATPGRPTLQKS